MSKRIQDTKTLIRERSIENISRRSAKENQSKQYYKEILKDKGDNVVGLKNTVKCLLEEIEDFKVDTRLVKSKLMSAVFCFIENIVYKMRLATHANLKTIYCEECVEKSAEILSLKSKKNLKNNFPDNQYFCEQCFDDFHKSMNMQTYEKFYLEQQKGNKEGLEFKKVAQMKFIWKEKFELYNKKNKLKQLEGTQKKSKSSRIRSKNGPRDTRQPYKRFSFLVKMRKVRHLQRPLGPKNNPKEA